MVVRASLLQLDIIRKEEESSIQCSETDTVCESVNEHVEDQGSQK